MIALPLPPKTIKQSGEKNKNKAIFEIQGLYPGYGVTIGNSLRRVLLSSLPGVAVTEVKIKGVSHEFSTVSGVLEDVIMLILNLKKLRFKIHEGESHRVHLNVTGEKEVKGSDFKLFSQIELVNPETHIATLTDKKTEFDVEIQIEKGIGYVPKDQVRKGKAEIGSITLDAIFTPIKNVNFQVENMRVGDRTDFDKLSIEIETDGTLTPEQAFYDACDILLKHFNIIMEGKNGGQAKEEAGAASEEKESDSSKMSVEELDVSTRTLNALLDNNIKTVGGLLRKNEKTLSELEGMGDKAITEIKKALKKIGSELKAE